MLLDPQMGKELDTRIHHEIGRLQKLSPGVDILGTTGRTIEDISGIVSSSVEKYLRGLLFGKGGSVEYEYNIPWMTQVLLKRGSTQKDLRIDSADQILYKTEPNIHLPITGYFGVDVFLSSIPDSWLFYWFVKNMDQVVEVLEQLQNAISEKKDILILSNHATWFNLPLIAHCLHRIFGIPKENIYTVVGPAITHSEWSLAGILRFSNVLKTLPDTERAVASFGRIREIRNRFLDQINEIFDLENQTGYSRIVLVAPSGTTDKIDSDGNISMAQPSKGTRGLVKRLLKNKGLSGYVVGVNDTAIIPPGHSRPQKGNAFVGIQRVDSDNWQETMPSCILDQYGNTIGKWSEK